MANFYTDNPSLRHHLQHPLMQKIVALRERDYTEAQTYDYAPRDFADAMDNYPEPVVLPRERSDEESAKVLSSVLPVILEQNDYEQTYSDNWWEKLKHGTAAYGVFWNNQKENGLGDIDIRPIDLLKHFGEPGVTDIQKSRNLFLVELVDEEVLEEQAGTAEAVPEEPQADTPGP